MSIINRIRPMWDRVLVRRLQAEAKTAGGILLPENARRKIKQGVVISVGPGKEYLGKVQPLTVKVGETVLLPEYGGICVDKGDLAKDDSEYILFKEVDLMAIIGEST